MMTAALDAAKAKKPRRKGRFEVSTSGGATWESVNRGLLVDAIAAVATSGGALRLGYTRDGGAYAIGIYGDGEPYTVYLRPTDDFDGFLRNLARDFAKAP